MAKKRKPAAEPLELEPAYEPWPEPETGNVTTEPEPEPETASADEPLPEPLPEQQPEPAAAEPAEPEPPPVPRPPAVMGPIVAVPADPPGRLPRLRERSNGTVFPDPLDVLAIEAAEARRRYNQANGFLGNGHPAAEQPPPDAFFVGPHAAELRALSTWTPWTPLHREVVFLLPLAQVASEFPELRPEDAYDAGELPCVVLHPGTILSSADPRNTQGYDYASLPFYSREHVLKTTRELRDWQIQCEFRQDPPTKYRELRRQLEQLERATR
jgi:hypothetical protein